jgi:hypothetical protein
MERVASLKSGAKLFYSTKVGHVNSLGKLRGWSVGRSARDTINAPNQFAALTKIAQRIG